MWREVPGDVLTNGPNNTRNKNTQRWTVINRRVALANTCVPLHVVGRRHVAFRDRVARKLRRGDVASDRVVLLTTVAFKDSPLALRGYISQGGRFRRWLYRIQVELDTGAVHRIRSTGKVECVTHTTCLAVCRDAWLSGGLGPLEPAL